MAENVIICDICGAIIEREEDQHNIDGTIYCTECLNTAIDDGDIEECAECGELHSIDNMRYIDNLEQYVCDDCIEDSGRYYFCDQCETYLYDTTYGSRNVYRPYRYYRNTMENGDTLCQSCFEDYGTNCCECGSNYYTNDMVYDDYTDRWYCQECYDRYGKKRKIHDYGYKPLPQYKCTKSDADGFYPSTSIRELLFGVELEVDDGDDPGGLAEVILESTEDVYFKHDGSLSDDCGVEIVSHPATLAYHLEELPWDEITATALENGFKSHNTNTCGLHVHVGRKQLARGMNDMNTVIANIILLLDRHRDNIIRFTRRESYKLERWASMPSHIPAKIKNEEEAKNWALYRAWNSDSRYHALNLQNNNTIEFRIFRGTLNLNTFRATLEFVSNLCLFAMNRSTYGCLASQFSEIVKYCKYPELDQYIEERRINLEENMPPFEFYTKSQAIENAIAIGERDALKFLADYPLNKPYFEHKNTYLIGDVVTFTAGIFQAIGVVVREQSPEFYTVKVIGLLGEGKEIEEVWKIVRNALHSDGGEFETNEYWNLIGRDLQEVLPF